MRVFLAIAMLAGCGRYRYDTPLRVQVDPGHAATPLISAMAARANALVGCAFLQPGPDAALIVVRFATTNEMYNRGQSRQHLTDVDLRPASADVEEISDWDGISGKYVVRSLIWINAETLTPDEQARAWLQMVAALIGNEILPAVDDPNSIRFKHVTRAPDAVQAMLDDFAAMDPGRSHHSRFCT